MKQLAWLLLLPIAGIVLSQDQPKPDEVGEAVVVSVEGDVEFRRPADSKKWAKLNKDHKLKGGDQIQTGLKSKCLLKLGEATRVLVRSSSFATLSKTFVEKNKVDGEVRLDVGSLYIEVDPAKRPEQMDFKVTTPMGTASIRGTGLFVNTGDMGSNFTQTHGVVLTGQERGPLSQLDDNSKSKDFPLIGGGDLSVLNGMNFTTTPTSEPNLATNQGSSSPNQSFTMTQDFTSTGNDLGGSSTCSPLGNGTNDSNYVCDGANHWGFTWNGFGPNGNFTVNNIDPTVSFRSTTGVFGTEFFGTVGGTDQYHLRPTGAGPQNWKLTNLLTGQIYNWDATNKVWQ